MKGWPLGIAIGLLIVVLVNVAFTVIAVGSAPVVEPDYEAAGR
jgi:hypothetical protein